MNELSINEKLYGLSQIWMEAKYNFAFFNNVADLDWDKAYRDFIPLVMETKSTVEYYRVLQRFVALLKDGHTYVVGPLAYWNEFGLPKVGLAPLNGKIIVKDACTCENNEGLLGAEVIEVDGVSTKEYLENEVFPYLPASTNHALWQVGARRLLLGTKDSEVTIKLCTKEGKVEELKLTRKNEEINRLMPAYITEGDKYKAFEFKELEDGIAYISINTFMKEEVVEGFEKHLEELKRSKGIIIDMRKNSGGNSDFADAIVKHFTDKPFIASRYKTREHNAEFKSYGKYFAAMTKEERDNINGLEPEWIEKMISYYNGEVWKEDTGTITPTDSDFIKAPVVVLIGANTFSSAEDFLTAMDAIKRGTFVGQTSNGSSGNPLVLDLPGGAVAGICTKRMMLVDGEEFCGEGIKPHVYVEETCEDILGKTDSTLEKGLEILKENIAH